MTNVILHGEETEGIIQTIRADDHYVGIIPIEHCKLHDGNYYNLTYTKTVAQSSYAGVWMYNPSTEKECHIVFEYSIDNPGSILISETLVTGSSTWLSISPVNMNRLSTNSSTCMFYSGAISGTTGTALWRDVIGTGGKTTMGGSGKTNDEFVITPNTTVCVQFTNNSTEARIAFKFTYYELEK